MNPLRIALLVCGLSAALLTVSCAQVPQSGAQRIEGAAAGSGGPRYAVDAVSCLALLALVVAIVLLVPGQTIP